jgi:hypothetical protein
MHDRSAFETHSLPTLTRSYPRRFTFYVAHPIRSIQFVSFRFLFLTLLKSSFLLLKGDSSFRGELPRRIRQRERS